MEDEDYLATAIAASLSGGHQETDSLAVFNIFAEKSLSIVKSGSEVELQELYIQPIRRNGACWFAAMCLAMLGQTIHFAYDVTVDDSDFEQNCYELRSS